MPLPNYPGASATIASSINNKGEIVGTILLGPFGTIDQLGFILRDGKFETFKIPGAAFLSANGISDKGDVVRGGGSLQSWQRSDPPPSPATSQLMCFLLSVPARLDELRGDFRLLIAVLPDLFVRRRGRLGSRAVAFAMDDASIFALHKGIEGDCGIRSLRALIGLEHGAVIQSCAAAAEAEPVIRSRKPLRTDCCDKKRRQDNDFVHHDLHMTRTMAA